MPTTAEIQARLNEVLGTKLALDGDFGPKTKSAVAMFQASRGLVADGEVGPRTIAALFPAMPATEHARGAGGLINAARIRAFAPSALPAIVAVIADSMEALSAAGLTTQLRVQHFMAQVAVESAGLVRLVENLSYSAKRLHQVWPSRFPSEASAQPYAHNPEALANKVYGGRLGNTHPGDGWRYRGSGLLGTTGRSNFADAGHEDDPEALRTPGPALASALRFWTIHGCNAFADRDDIVRVRIAINGGVTGLEDAKGWLRKANGIFL